VIRNQIDRFFQILAKELDELVTVVLTGAAAGILWGSSRPSRDVDFAIRPDQERPDTWERIEQAVERTVKLTGIMANFAKDIDRWGTITLLDYWEKARPYRQFGKLKLFLMDPAYWSIGKIGRYLESDVQDLLGVLSRKKVPVARLVRLWAKALRQSPPSSDCFRFRRQAESFLRTYGRSIWGKRFDPEGAIALFHRAAKISP